MHQAWFGRAVLATLVWLGVTAELLRADEALPMPNPPRSSAPVYEQPVPLEGPHVSSGEVVLTGPRLAVERPGRPLRNYLIVNVPLFCWAHHNGLGCGNIRSEFNFMFGSCRTFYGEPCFRGPPPQPVPLDALYGSGGYGPGGSAGCRCP